MYEATDLRWWQHKSEEDKHQAAWQAYEQAKEGDRGRAESYRVLRDYYTYGVVQADIPPATIEGAVPLRQCRHNIIASVIDTAQTKLLEARPNPQVLTAGGNVKLQRQAKKLSKWTLGASQRMKLHSVMESAGREKMQVGTGALRVFERNGRPACEIAYCDEIYVDPLEAYHDAVLTYYQERRVDRSVLLARFPKKKAQILEAERVSTIDEADISDPRAGTSDMVLVVQAWRVAMSDDEADVGEFVVLTSSGMLHSEPYESEEAPFIFLRWRRRPRSFWGIGLCEMLAGLQEQADRNSETIDETLDAMPPAVFARAGTIKRAQMDDGIARLYEIDGSPGDIQLWAPGSAAVDGHTRREQRIEELLYQLGGVSSMEAGAQKPAGLNSGRAQLVHQDIKSQRLLMQHRELEDAYAEAFRRIIEVADGIEERAGDKDSDTNKDRLRYLSGEGEDLEEIAFGDARIKDALYRVQVFPVSKLPDSPAGLLEFVTELVNAGIVQGDEALGLMNFPDVKALVANRMSAQEFANILVDKATEGIDVLELLTPDDDLDAVLRYGRQVRARAMMDGSSHDDLSELRELISVAATLKTQMQKAAEAAAMPAAAAGPAALPPQAPPMVGQ